MKLSNKTVNIDHTSQPLKNINYFVIIIIVISLYERASNWQFLLPLLLIFQHSNMLYLFSILSLFQVYSASPIFGVEFETEEKVFIILSFLIYNL